MDGVGRVPDVAGKDVIEEPDSDDLDDDDLVLDELGSPASFHDRSDELLKSFGSDEPAWRILPFGIRRFIDRLTLTRFILMLLCVILPLDILVYLVKGGTRTVTAPKQSLALSSKLAKQLLGGDIPPYVLTYAPYVLLDESEEFFPGDILALIQHTYPAQNFTDIAQEFESHDPLSLDNLNDLNEYGVEEVYLTSKQDLSKTPSYLHGKKPDPKTLQTKNAKSCVIIVNDLGDGVVHAFYIYWYTYNKGPVVAGREFGNHLGDWEHNMIRFENGNPQSVWYSQHGHGLALTYNATEKLGVRPLVYPGMGTHANYASAGFIDLHNLDPQIPANIAFDHTSKGPLWDPTLSAYYYTLSFENDDMTFKPALPDTPVSYLYFTGHWGDLQYPEDDPRQVNFHGVLKFISGPNGPRFKQLNRTNVCKHEDEACVVLDEIPRVR